MRPSRPLALVLATAGLVAITAAPALAAVPALGETQLVSVNADGTAGGNQSVSTAVVSGNGRYVVFSSIGNDYLTPNTTGFEYRVYRRDLVTDTTILVSVAIGGAEANAGSSSPAVSYDGRFVAFASTATNLDPLDTTGLDDVFLRDIDLGTTTLVSVNSAGTAGGDKPSYAPAISADGSLVTFTSYATDLVASDTNNKTDVFARTVGAATPVTSIVSLRSTGAQTLSDSGYSRASISTDGRYVAFDSLDTSIVPAGSTGYQVYRRDLQTSTVVPVSFGSGGTGTGNAFGPSMSADGDLVAFSSDATDLVPEDSDGYEDVFVHSVSANTTALVSAPRASGGGTEDNASDASIAGNGLTVAFESNASNLVDQPVAGAGDIYVRSLSAAATSLVSLNSTGNGGGNDDSYGATLSGDGSIVAFASDATDLVGIDNSGFTDAFARGLPVEVVAGSALAHTGAPIGQLAGLGALTVMLGAAVLLVRKRRTA